MHDMSCLNAIAIDMISCASLKGESKSTSTSGTDPDHGKLDYSILFVNSLSICHGVLCMKHSNMSNVTEHVFTFRLCYYYMFTWASLTYPYLSKFTKWLWKWYKPSPLCDSSNYSPVIGFFLLVRFSLATYVTYRTININSSTNLKWLVFMMHLLEFDCLK